MITQEYLDVKLKEGCSQCGEHEHSLWVHPKCHPHEGLSAKYTQGGKLELSCQLCAEYIMEVEIK